MGTRCIDWLKNHYPEVNQCRLSSSKLRFFTFHLSHTEVFSRVLGLSTHTCFCDSDFDTDSNFDFDFDSDSDSDSAY